MPNIMLTVAVFLCFLSSEWLASLVYTEHQLGVNTDKFSENVLRQNASLKHFVLSSNGYGIQQSQSNKQAGASFSQSPCSVLNKVVDCSSLSLETIHPSWFPSDAHVILLNNNHLTSLVDSSFAHVSNLTDLDLSSNEISRLEPRAFRGLTNLTTLNLNGNRLCLNTKHISEQTFSDLPNLKVLNIIHDTDLRDCNVSHTYLEPLRNLQRLSIGANEEVLYFGSEFRSLTSLEALEVTGSAQVIHDKTFENLGAIQELHLKNMNNLFNVSSSVFVPLTHLLSLKMENVLVDVQYALSLLEPFVGKNMTEIYFNIVSTTREKATPNKNGLLTRKDTKYLLQICVRSFTLINSYISYISMNAFGYSSVWSDCLYSLFVSDNPLQGSSSAMFPLTKYTHLETITVEKALRSCDRFHDFQYSNKEAALDTLRKRREVAGLDTLRKRREVTGLDTLRKRREVAGLDTLRKRREVTGLDTLRKRREVAGLDTLRKRREVAGLDTLRKRREVAGLDTLRKRREVAGLDTLRKRREVAGLDTLRKRREVAGLDTLRKRREVAGLDTLRKRREVAGLDTLRKRREVAGLDTLRKRREVAGLDTLRKRREVAGLDTLRKRREVAALDSLRKLREVTGLEDKFEMNAVGNDTFTSDAGAPNFIIIKLPVSLRSLQMSRLVSSVALDVNLLFLGAANVDYLDVSDNGFKTFVGNIQGLHSLKTAVVSLNDMRELKESFFDGFFGLEKLFLSKCELQRDFMALHSSRVFQNLSNLQSLDLSYNYLNALSQGTLYYNPKLIWLNLSDNQFNCIPFDLKDTPNLLELDVRNNAISTLSKSMTTELDQLALRNGKLNFWLSGNILSCGCQDLNFLHWLSSTMVTLDQGGNFTCMDRNGERSYTMRYSHVDTLWRECWGQYFLYLAIIILCFYLIGVFLLVLVQRNKTFLVSFFLQLLGNFKLLKRGDYPIDVFVGYSDEDYHFPCRVLRLYLEDVLKLKTFLNDRDLLASLSKASGIVDAINSSYRILLVCSESFMKDDDWSLFTMRAAMYAQSPANPSRVVIVVHESCLHLLPTELLSVVNEENILVVSGWKLNYEMTEMLRTRLQ
ncbi:TLR cluster1 member 1 [Biomphalaria glabrata]|nr:toll-like receptor 5 isoform X2 [Biomphalaria glabrata]KAI8794867.1 toll receptor 5 isoform X2 [Biomphalaria glabrata]